MNFAKFLRTPFAIEHFRATASEGLKTLTGQKAPSNKTPALTKSRNIGFWVVSTSNPLFRTGS